MPIYLYKPIGQTPNELIDKYKKENVNAKKVSFAGRLDPMAHGTMALLVNEECKLHDTYISRDKTYEFEILFGFKTDTFDVLGKLLEFNNPNEFNSLIENINLENYTKIFNQEYPPYSRRRARESWPPYALRIRCFLGHLAGRLLSRTLRRCCRA